MKSITLTVTKYYRSLQVIAVYLKRIQFRKKDPKMKTEKKTQAETRKLSLVVCGLSIFVFVLFGLMPSA